MSNRVIKASDIRMVRVYARSGSYQWSCEGGMNGRFRLYVPNGQGQYVEVELLEVEIEDTAPAYADALHKLAEQSDRNVDLAKRLQREQDRNFELSCTVDAERQAHAEHVEHLHQAIADERATAAALQTELNAVRAELIDRDKLHKAVDTLNELSRQHYESAAAHDRMRYDLQQRRDWPYQSNHTSELSNLRHDVRELIGIVTRPRGLRRLFRKGK